MLGDVTVGGAIAGGGASSNMQDRLGNLGVEHEGAGQPGGGAGTFQDEVLGGGGDLQLRGVAPAGVELLAGGHGESRGKFEGAAGELGGGACGGDGAFVDVLCLRGDGGAHELVRVGFDDDEARLFAGYFFDEQVGGFVKAAFEGTEGAGCGVPAADSAVVGVGDGDGPVGQFGQTEGVLHAGGVGVAVDEAEVEETLAYGGGDLYAALGEGDVA